MKTACGLVYGTRFGIGADVCEPWRPKTRVRVHRRRLLVRSGGQGVERWDTARHSLILVCRVRIEVWRWRRSEQGCSHQPRPS